MRDTAEQGLVERLRTRFTNATARGDDMFEEYRNGGEGRLVFSVEEQETLQYNSMVHLQDVTDSFLQVNGDPNKTDEDLREVTADVLQNINAFTYVHGLNRNNIVLRTKFAKAIDYCMQQGISLSSLPERLTPDSLISFVENRAGLELSGQDNVVQQALESHHPDYSVLKPVQKVVEAEPTQQAGLFSMDPADADIREKAQPEKRKPRRWGRVIAAIGVVTVIGVGMISWALSGTDESPKSMPQTTTSVPYEVPTTTTIEAPATTVALTTTSDIPTTIVTIPVAPEIPVTTAVPTTIAEPQAANPTDSSVQAPASPQGVGTKIGTPTPAIPATIALEKGENLYNGLQDIIAGSHGRDIDRNSTVNRSVNAVLGAIATANHRTVKSLDTIRVAEPIQLDAFAANILRMAQAGYRA